MGRFWAEVLAEVLGSIPVFGLGLWFSHRKLKAHVTTLTRAQTGDIELLTEQQTRQLTGALDSVTAEQTEQLEGRSHTRP